MRWILVTAAGVAGLLLGGPVVAVTTAVLAQVGYTLRLAIAPRA